MKMDATLGEYLEFTIELFGEGKATYFLREVISEVIAGEDEVVTANGGEMITVLAAINFESKS